MATHSSVLAWRIPWTEEPGGLQSMGSQSAGHCWVTKCTHIFKAGQFYFWFFFTLSSAVRWNSVYLLKHPVTTWSETLHCRVWSHSVMSDSLLDSCPPGSSIRGVFQASILEWIAFPSRGDLPSPGLEPGFPTLQADALPSEPAGKPKYDFTEPQRGPPFQPAPPLPNSRSQPLEETPATLSPLQNASATSNHTEFCRAVSSGALKIRADCSCPGVNRKIRAESLRRWSGISRVVHWGNLRRHPFDVQNLLVIVR